MTWRSGLLGSTDKRAAIIGWATAQSFQMVSVSRDSDGAVISASIVWPDGVMGTYTGTPSTSFPGATDAWVATYDSAVPKTVTQPAVTRDADGAVIVQPAIVVT